MNSKRYDRDGKYAATWHFENNGADFLLDSVFQGYIAVGLSVIGDYQCGCLCFNWSSDYIETALKLLGYTEASELVKKDFRQSALLFTECFDKKVGRAVK